MRTPTLIRPDSAPKAEVRRPRRGPDRSRRRQLQLVFEAVVSNYIHDIATPRAHAATPAGVRA
jgi:hypothetical protein